MSFFINIIKGIVIGSGAILPGISSGVMCVVFGIYEELLNRLLNFFKSPFENFKFFFPYLIGGLIGVFLVGKLLLYLFNSFYIATCCAFIGLILGCIPNIMKQCKTNLLEVSIFNKILHWLCLLLAFMFSVYLMALKVSHNSGLCTLPTSFDLSISGFFMSAGVVIPGVSSSAILMIIGIYETYLSAISNINLEILLPMGIGLIIGGYLFLKIINILFKFFRSYTYYAIIGFTLGSVLVIFPGFNANLEGIIGIILFAICFIISSSLGKMK